MARLCRVCAHPDRAEIDGHLVEGQIPVKRVAQLYGVPKSNMFRHRAAHLPKALAKAAEAAEVAQSGKLLAKLQSLISRADAIAKNAEKAKDGRTALAALREIRGSLELLAKLSGELERENPGELHLHVDVDPETAMRIAETYVARRRPAAVIDA